MLELIDKGSVSDDHPVPLLFVHGGFHAAWCWADNFLDYFADNGFRAVAVSLPAHGNSPRTKRLHSYGVADYVEGVRWAAGELGGAPVLIGHSLGGFTVQQYLQTYCAPAAVLVASLPPQGVLHSTTWVVRRHPFAG